MKVLKSIKWRLQIWYGLILVFVLTGFGIIAYQLERIHVFYQINAELNWRFGIVANALHRPPPRGLNPEGQLFDRPLPGQFPNDGPPGQNLRSPIKFTLPPEAAGLFGSSDPNNFYYIIQSRDEKEIAHSDNAPPEKLIPPVNIQLNPADIRAEIDKTLPSGERIQIGCHITPELKKLWRTALTLTAVGGLILLIGLAGGWWLVSRAIKPIDDISAAAVKISAGDLSQRINVAEAESELGKLASVLNSTFARLDAAFAQQKQFASDAAHELRTPVAVVLTQTQTALNRERSRRNTVRPSKPASARRSA